jgi:predicted secreted protein
MGIKRFAVYALAAGWFLAVSGCAPGADTRAAARTYTDDALVIEAVMGDVFIIELPSNPTLPYRWELEIQGPVARLGETFTRTPPVLTGSGGISAFTFEAAGAGPATITLSYIGADGTVSDKKTFRVEIAPA